MQVEELTVFQTGTMLKVVIDVCMFRIPKKKKAKEEASNGILQYTEHEYDKHCGSQYRSIDLMFFFSYIIAHRRMKTRPLGFSNTLMK
ncbi:hypothetical protein Y032_0005g2324 [Ancylostoma ceylanicum]|uniref:Uncharacterized protein n=1 Tax=Ancylostoma ceylanicum TaxID=53326 RepID=A0A016VR55_9BILA|nr:hypothetical protein Y032_0005g2324 [Ancylostoma ceylanicum]